VVASHQKEVSPERESADEAALAWLVRLTSGESTPEDHDRFRDWRDESPRHAEALHRARMLWTTLGSTIPAIEHNRVRSLARRRLVQRALAIAASIALVVGLGLHYRQVWQYDEVTGTGEHRHLVLSDGSRVLLGAGAALSEHFDNAERRLTLARGQAYFEVRHDARRPFVVTAGAGEIRDIGTSFTVALGEDRARAFVVNGVVEASRGRQRLRLIAGQSVEISRSGVGPVSSADMAVATAWMRRKLLLSNRPLTEIITAMAPYYSRRIVLLNRAAAETPMSAAIDLDEKGVEEWLAALERSGTVRLLHLPGIVVLR
jgi:transmembrane sensor